MSRILRFQQINDEYSWKDFIKRNKKLSINDLYISNHKSTEIATPPDSSNTY